MPFFKKAKTPPVSNPAHLAETREQIMQRRARDVIRTLQNHSPRAFEKLLSEVEQGDYTQARLTLRGLASIVDEGYIEPVLQVLETQSTSSHQTSQQALQEHPDALRILLRSGNRPEAIELYQKRTGVDWQTALAAIKDLEQKLAEGEA